MALLKGYDLLILTGLIVLLFGSTLIPRFARSLGEAAKELKKINKTEDTSTERHDSAV